MRDDGLIVEREMDNIPIMRASVLNIVRLPILRRVLFVIGLDAFVSRIVVHDRFHLPDGRNARRDAMPARELTGGAQVDRVQRKMQRVTRRSDSRYANEHAECDGQSNGQLYESQHSRLIIHNSPHDHGKQIVSGNRAKSLLYTG